MIDPDTSIITEQTYEIWKAIQCEPETSRLVNVSEEQFKNVRKSIEGYIRNGYLKAIQAPLTIKPKLVTWMQLV